MIIRYHLCKVIQLTNRITSIDNVSRTESEYTEFIKKIAQNEIDLNAVISDLREKAGDKDFIIELMDLLYMDQHSRVDSPYSDYLSPELIHKSLEVSGKYSDTEIKWAKIIFESFQDNIEEYAKTQQLVASIQNTSLEIERSHNVKFIVNKLQRIANNFQVAGIPVDELDNLFVKTHHMDIVENTFRSKYEVNEEKILDLFHKDNLESIIMTLQKVKNQSISKYSLRSINDRKLYYQRLCSEMKPDRISKMAQIIQDIIVAQADMPDVPGTLANDTKTKLWEPLSDYYNKLHNALNSLNISNAKIVPLLGDGEPLAFIDFLHGNNNVDLLYVSRLTMMTENEFQQYTNMIEENPHLATKGSTKSNFLIYRALYPPPGSSEVGIYNQAVESAKAYRAELITHQMKLKDHTLSLDYEPTTKTQNRFYRNELTPGTQSMINKKVQQKFLFTFRELVQKRIDTDPAFKAKAKEIYDNQIEPLIQTGDPLIFVDSGLKGTIPAFLCSLTDIFSGENYLSQSYTPKASIFMFAVIDSSSKVVMHAVEGRKSGKSVEDAGKFGTLNLNKPLNKPEIVSTDLKNTILATLDAYNMQRFYREEQEGVTSDK